MLNWLHTLPNFGIFGLIVGTVLGAVALAPRVRTHVLRVPDHEAVANGAFEAFKAITAVTGFVLALSLANVQTAMRSTEELVGKEATAISTVDRTMLRYGDPTLASLRPTLRAYVQAIIDDEWRLLARGGASAKVSDLYTQISRTARATEPATPRQQTLFADLTRGLDDIYDLREARIAASAITLPGLFWDTTAGLLVMLVILAAMMPATLERTFTLAGLAGAVALLLSLVVVIDGPFGGETSVQPTAFQRTLTQMEARR